MHDRQHLWEHRQLRPRLRWLPCGCRPVLQCQAADALQRLLCPHETGCRTFQMLLLRMKPLPMMTWGAHQDWADPATESVRRVICDIETRPACAQQNNVVCRKSAGSTAAHPETLKPYLLLGHPEGG